jgi:hypothetical protein
VKCITLGHCAPERGGSGVASKDYLALITALPALAKRLKGVDGEARVVLGRWRGDDGIRASSAKLAGGTTLKS